MNHKITRLTIDEAISKNKLELKSTHKRLCLPIINRIYRKMSAGIRFPPIKIENGLICDGHHRYVASILAEYDLEKIQGKITSATTESVWASVVFDEDDWDTQARIAMLNQQDSDFNSISVEEIVQLLKQQ